MTNYKTVGGVGTALVIVGVLLLYTATGTKLPSFVPKFLR